MARAELAWDKITLGLHPAPGAELAETDFLFANRSNAPVTIVEITPSCGCVSATPSQKIIAPGESGKLHAIFKTGGLVGHLSKSIRVITDETGVPPVTLNLEIDLTAPFILTPRLLHWKRGAETASLRADLRIADGALVGTPKIGAAPDGFATELRRLPDSPGHFEIVVTPENTPIAKRGSLLVQFAGAANGRGDVPILLVVEGTPAMTQPR